MSNPCDDTKRPYRNGAKKNVQERLGHASGVETLDAYSHLWPDYSHLWPDYSHLWPDYSRLWPDSDDRARDAIDLVLGSTADEDRTDELNAQARPTT